MSRLVSNIIVCDSITSPNPAIVIAGGKRLETEYIKAPSGSVVFESGIELGGALNVTGINLTTTKRISSSFTEPIECNSNFEVASNLDLRCDKLASTTPAGTVACADNLTVHATKRLRTSLIASASIDPTDWVDIENKARVPVLSCDLVEAKTTGQPITVAASMNIADGQILKTNTLDQTTGTRIFCAPLTAGDVQLKSGGNVQINYADSQALVLTNLTAQSINNSLRPLFIDPSTNAVVSATYTTNPVTSRSLVEFFTMNRFESVPYTTIQLPSYPQELIDIVNFLIPSDFQFIIDAIPNFTPTETTTVQNAYIYADSGVWKVRGSDLAQLVAATAMPKDANINGGLVLSQPEDMDYDTGFSLCKPWFMNQSATAGFRFECWFSMSNIMQGITTVALVSAQTDAENPLKYNGYTSATAYFHNSIFIFSDPAINSAQITIRLNKSTSPSSSSTALYGTNITPTAGRLVRCVLEWTPALAGMSVRVEHTGSTTYTNTILNSGGFLPNASMFMPLIAQSRKASEPKVLHLNRLICQQFNV